MAKKTTITIETSSLLILQERNATEAWCQACGAEADTIELSTSELSTLDQWLNSHHVHRSENRDGSVRICLNSLLSRLQTTKPADHGFPRLPNKEEI